MAGVGHYIEHRRKPTVEAPHGTDRIGSIQAGEAGENWSKHLSDLIRRKKKAVL